MSETAPGPVAYQRRADRTVKEGSAPAIFLMWRRLSEHGFNTVAVCREQPTAAWLNWGTVVS